MRRLVVPALAGDNPAVCAGTGRGTITLELLPANAPLTVNKLPVAHRRGYYRNTRFTASSPNFVAQDGDPRGEGRGGGPGYAIRDELNRLRYDRGALGMARSPGPIPVAASISDTSAQPHLDGGYTVFGRVTGGFSVLDAIVEGDRLIEARIR